MVPIEKRSVVEKALQVAFGTSTTEEASPMTGGISSALRYRVQIAGQKCVVRLVMMRDALRDPARHYSCLELASTAGIAPSVLYTNAKDGISITRFVQPPPRSPGPILLLPLAYSIRQIHALPPFPHMVGFLDWVDNLIESFKASALLPEALTEEHFRYYAQIQRFYPRTDLDTVSSHNDLNPGNLIFDGTKLWIVDWESAFRGDRFVDLAIAATNFMQDEAEIEPFLQAYFGVGLNDYLRDRFFLMRRVSEMYYALGFMSVASSRSPLMVADASMETPTLAQWRAKVGTGESRSTSEGQVLVGKVFINECLRWMKTPRFEMALTRMGVGRI